MGQTTWERYMQLPKVSETAIQQALVEWWRYYCRRLRLPEDAFIHIANEGKRSYRTAALLKSMGMRKGVSDIFLSVPVSPHHGLWLELKTKTGRATTEQTEFIRMQRELGYAAMICHGFDEAKEAVERYLDPLLPVLRK